MKLTPAIQIIEAARRSADAIVRTESARWSDAQYDRFVARHYRDMAAESLRFLEVLRARDRDMTAMLRSLESSR